MTPTIVKKRPREGINHAEILSTTVPSSKVDKLSNIIPAGVIVSSSVTSNNDQDRKKFKPPIPSFSQVGIIDDESTDDELYEYLMKGYSKISKSNGQSNKSLDNSEKNHIVDSNPPNSADADVDAKSNATIHQIQAENSTIIDSTWKHPESQNKIISNNCTSKNDKEKKTPTANLNNVSENKVKEDSNINLGTITLKQIHNTISNQPPQNSPSKKKFTLKKCHTTSIKPKNETKNNGRNHNIKKMTTPSATSSATSSATPSATSSATPSATTATTIATTTATMAATTTATTTATTPSATAATTKATARKKPKAKPKPRAKRTKAASSKAKPCVLCSTCSCKRTSDFKSLEAKGDKSIVALRVRSDDETERALIERLGRLEKSASHYDSLCINVSRELKKHQRKILATRKESRIAGSENQPSSRLDAHEESKFHEDKKLAIDPFSPTLVEKATRKTYSFRRKCQPTLTQTWIDESSEIEYDEAKTCHSNNVDTIDTLKSHDESGYEKNNLKSDESDVSTSDDIKGDNLEALEDYEIASSRGQVRSLWGLSGAPIEREYEEKTSLDEYISSQNQLELSTSFYLNESLFQRLLMDDNCGMDVLMNILDDGVNDEQQLKSGEQAIECENDGNSLEETDHTTLSQLSQKGKDIYRSIESRIQSDTAKANIIEEVCPNWKENIRYAFHQRPQDIRAALDNVQQKRCKLQKMKIQLLDQIQKQDLVMELFETTLETRLDNQVDELPCKENIEYVDFQSEVTDELDFKINGDDDI